MKISRPIHILLVEDNPGDVRLAKEAFRECQIKIVLSVASDGVEALRFLRKEKPFEESRMPDLILLDLNLPKMDGREVLKIIKTDPNFMRIPVVVLTTSNARQDILHSYDLHVNCFINKPIDFDHFFKIIKRIEEFWLNTAILPTMAE